MISQAVSREFICEECQNSTLNKLESMLEILQSDTKQGTVTPTEIADNILNIMGKEPAARCLPAGATLVPLPHPSSEQQVIESCMFIAERRVNISTVVNQITYCTESEGRETQRDTKASCSIGANTVRLDAG